MRKRQFIEFTDAGGSEFMLCECTADHATDENGKEVEIPGLEIREGNTVNGEWGNLLMRLTLDQVRELSSALDAYCRNGRL